MSHSSHHVDTHVKVLAVLHILVGVLGLLGALVVALIVGGAADFVGLTGDPHAGIAMPIISIAGIAFASIILVRSLPGLVIGIGMLNVRSWARIGGIVLSIVDLAWIPFGTLVGVYGLWVLFSVDAKRLFTSSAGRLSVSNLGR